MRKSWKIFVIYLVIWNKMPNFAPSHKTNGTIPWRAATPLWSRVTPSYIHCA
ncbi:hypothetical protein EVA_16936 [gut metagenome]|uniref:Uncharacterized protein n=1 Tax=gut metagenome TaxID=749906 RepID=J9FKK3_9ZZZZ